MSITAAAPDPVSAAVDASLRAMLAAHQGTRPLREAVALSGGRDSMVLLDALVRRALAEQVIISAVHVDHGLSPNAGSWAAICREECARRGVALTVAKVDVDRTPGRSREAAARAARYAAIAAVDADVVALAHHADDQAETVLLQLLRGAGPQGLAAMPASRTAQSTPSTLRPLLDVPRAAIDAYALAFHVRWIDDESNADTRIRRNFLRHEIAPRLAGAFPGYPATLARAAAHQAEAAALLDELAKLDAGTAAADIAPFGLTLERDALATLSGGRARNLLRWFLRQHALAAPSAARLAAMLMQLANAAPDARVRLEHAGVELGLHRGRVVVHAPPSAHFEVRWNGEAELALPPGVLRWKPVVGNGLARSALDASPVVVRRRGGGERIQLAANRPRQALKGLL